MKSISFALSLFFIIAIYSCQKNLDEQTIPSSMELEADSRHATSINEITGLPKCGDIELAVAENETYNEDGCCEYSFIVFHSGKRDPLVRINGVYIWDYTVHPTNPLIEPDKLSYIFAICDPGPVLIEIIGEDSYGNHVVCESYTLNCDNCCVRSSMRVSQASNNSNTECCRYQVVAENNSECEYFIPKSGTNVNLPPKSSQTFGVTVCEDDGPTVLRLLDKIEGTSCKPLSLDCSSCCDEGGVASFRVNGSAQVSDREGCCEWRVRVANNTDCTLELLQDGGTLMYLPPGFAQLIVVEVCGLGDSNLFMYNPLSENHEACLSIALPNVCSE